jgi:hypothetical protein
MKKRPLLVRAPLRPWAEWGGGHPEIARPASPRMDPPRTPGIDRAPNRNRPSSAEVPIPAGPIRGAPVPVRAWPVPAPAWSLPLRVWPFLGRLNLEPRARSSRVWRRRAAPGGARRGRAGSVPSRRFRRARKTERGGGGSGVRCGRRAGREGRRRRLAALLRRLGYRVGYSSLTPGVTSGRKRGRLGQFSGKRGCYL